MKWKLSVLFAALMSAISFGAGCATSPHEFQQVKSSAPVSRHTPTDIDEYIEGCGGWQKRHTPYRIHGNILIPAGSTLTIKPGVVVEFLGHYHLRIDGRINVRGTERQPVTFTCDDRERGWGGIRILRNREDNIFDHVIFEYGLANGPYRSPHHGPDMEGAGVYMKDSSARFEHCLFQHNRATVHGSAFSAFGWMDIVIDQCRFFSNKTLQNLAGMGALHFHSEGKPVERVWVTNCEIAFNTATDDAAGIGFWSAFTDASVVIANNLVYRNTCHGAWAPGTSAVARFGEGLVVNNVFYGNTLAEGATGPNRVLIAFDGPTIFKNNIVYGNTGHDMIFHNRSKPIVSRNCIQDGYAEDDNFDANPQFRDPSEADFRLRRSSECIDSGDDSVLESITQDRVGKRRLRGKKVDIGAYEV